MMIPLRRALIREQHGYLKYPEGTACAEVLKASASDESRAVSTDAAVETEDNATSGGKIISIGFAAGFLYVAVMKILSAWKEYPTKNLEAPLKGGSVSLENNPALLGVGYIIGPRIAGIMFAGGVLSYLVLMPLIYYFGSNVATPIAPGTVPVGE